MRGGEGESVFSSEGAENVSTCSLLDIFFIIYLFKLYRGNWKGKTASLSNEQNLPGKISAAFRKGGLCQNRHLWR